MVIRRLLKLYRESKKYSELIHLLLKEQAARKLTYEYLLGNPSDTL